MRFSGVSVARRNRPKPASLAAGLHHRCKVAASAGRDRPDMTTTTTTTTAADRLLDVVRGIRSAGPDIYADDATFDAVVPDWRFPLTGAEPIRYQLAEWYAFPAELEEVERHPTADGEVVAFTATWSELGVPFAARQIHVLTIVDDRITRQQVWCGGRWSSTLLAQMEEARR
jgi:hypothetical protein